MSAQTSGIHLQKSVGQNYAIHIPHRHTKGEKVPLILLLHWGGRKYRWIGRDMLELVGLPALSELQAIIIAPDRKRRHWANEKALNDLIRLLDFLEHHYNLDSNKRLVVGYSIGGVGVWYIGSEAPSMFSCGISIAAPIPDHILDREWVFPIYSLHGRHDEAFPHDLNLSKAEILKDKGAPLEFETVENAMHTDIRNYAESFANARNWVEKFWGHQKEWSANFDL